MITLIAATGVTIEKMKYHPLKKNMKIWKKGEESIAHREESYIEQELSRYEQEKEEARHKENERLREGYTNTQAEEDHRLDDDYELNDDCEDRRDQEEEKEEVTGGSQKTSRKKSIEEFKKTIPCVIFHKLGHWKRECPEANKENRRMATTLWKSQRRRNARLSSEWKTFHCTEHTGLATVAATGEGI